MATVMRLKSTTGAPGNNYRTSAVSTTSMDDTVSSFTSSNDELMYGRNVTVSVIGAGSTPTHTPLVDRQTCVYTADGTVHEWWAGAWH